MNKDLPIGTKVFLSPDSRWADGEHNPIGVEGEVITQSTIWVVVRWGENLTNSYVGDENDLLLSNPLGDIDNLEEDMQKTNKGIQLAESAAKELGIKPETIPNYTKAVNAIKSGEKEITKGKNFLK